MDPESVCLSTLLSWVRDKRIPGLNNAVLRALGRNIEFYPGAIAFLSRLQRKVNENPRYGEVGLTLEFYVLSQGS